MTFPGTSPVARLIFGSAVYLLVCLYAAWMLWGSALIAGGVILVALLAGAGFITYVVRSLNRRAAAHESNSESDAQ